MNLSALSRRLARIEAQLPFGTGLIRVKRGMRGLHEAMAQVEELRERGLLPERDPNAPPSPMRRFRDAVIARAATAGKLGTCGPPGPANRESRRDCIGDRGMHGSGRLQSMSSSRSARWHHLRGFTLDRLSNGPSSHLLRLPFELCSLMIAVNAEQRLASRECAALIGYQEVMASRRQE